MKAVKLSEVGNLEFFYLYNRKNAQAYTKSVFELKNSQAVVIRGREHYEILSADTIVYVK